MSRSPQNIGIIRPVLHHVGLTTANIERMLDWYGRVLGMTLIHRSAKPLGTQTPPGVTAAWLTNDEANHRISLIALDKLTNEPGKPPRCRVQHIAFEYATIDELLATYERLKSEGIEPVLAADHGATTGFYYEDPDRNCVELSVDNFGDWKQSSESVRSSPDFAARPMGAYIDPAAMLAARAAGMSVQELHRRAYAGEFQPQTPCNPSVLL